MWISVVTGDVVFPVTVKTSTEIVTASPGRARGSSTREMDDKSYRSISLEVSAMSAKILQYFFYQEQTKSYLPRRIMGSFSENGNDVGGGAAGLSSGE